MASGQSSAFKRFLLWDYPRASWQYDVMVGLILAFLFLTPRDLFRDQPRASDIVRLPAEHGADMFWVESQVLDHVSEDARVPKVESELKRRFGKSEKVFRIEAVPEVNGYFAFAHP